MLLYENWLDLGELQWDLHFVKELQVNFMQNYKLILCIPLTPVFQVIKLVAKHVSMDFILSCSSRRETDHLKKISVE